MASVALGRSAGWCAFALRLVCSIFFFASSRTRVGVVSLYRRDNLGILLLPTVRDCYVRLIEAV